MAAPLVIEVHAKIFDCSLPQVTWLADSLNKGRRFRVEFSFPVCWHSHNLQQMTLISNDSYASLLFALI
jgi:hypothetical protein